MSNLHRRLFYPANLDRPSFSCEMGFGLGSAKTRNYLYKHSYLVFMTRKNLTFSIVVAILLAVLLMLTACANRVSNQANDDLDESCTSVITVSPDGHYMLNTRAITKDNADEINLCIEALGIMNVRVASNFSDILPAGNYT